MIEGAPMSEGKGLEIAIVVLVVGVLTLGAVKTFPQMDDAYLLLLLKERGAAALRAAHPERPLVGSIWQGLAVLTGSWFWRVGFLAHFALWSGLGLVTGGVWRRIFPAAARLAPIASVLAVAPVVVRTQLSTVTISLICVLSVLPVWVGMLCAWRYAESARMGWLILAIALTAGGALLTEYGVVAALSGAVLLAIFGPGSARRARASAVLIAGAGLASYLIYLRMGDFTVRPLVDPGKQLSRAGLPVRASLTLATRFWDAVAGDLFRAASAVQLEWQTKSSLVGIAFGAILGAVLWHWVGRSSDVAETAINRRGMAALAVSLGLGLLPIALMRPVFRSDFASRFEIAVLPVAASLSVAVLVAITRTRLLPVVAALLGVVVGAAVVQLIAGAVRQRRTFTNIAAAIEPVVDSRETVTIAVLSSNDLCHTSQVCTGMVTRDWTVDRGRRVWLETEADAFATMGGRTACHTAAPAGLAERGFERRVVSNGVLWVQVRDGAATIEPYCVGRVDERAGSVDGIR